MLAIIGIILVVCWIIGLVAHVTGGLIHLALLVALVMFVLHFMRGKKSV
ncbi:MAG: hypothetical protein JWL90_686 [Chthoniobacteraceae bacterium]|nr:hypothetical protein [Chthoniobacteraceae bacterium]